MSLLWLSTPKCPFIPKSRCWPFLVWCISGSRVPVAFFVDDGAAMIVASTMARAHRHAVRAHVAGHGLEHDLAELVFFEEVAELADRRLIGHRPAAQVDADEGPH